MRRQLALRALVLVIVAVLAFRGDLTTRAAEIEHVDGRNRYGLRHLHADLAEDVEGDARVLNRLGGWTRTQTRELDRRESRTGIDERTKRTRANIRPDVERDNEMDDGGQDGANA